MKNDFKILRDSAYTWDDRPHNYFNFSGRVVDKYGLPYIRSKLHFKYNYVADKNENENQAIGKFIESIKSEALVSEPAQNRFEREELHVVDMEVPANQYDTWVNSVPSKYFNEYKQKKLLLDQYLSKFNSHERNQVIRIMCENSDSKNYTHFLDIDPDAMTTQQYLIYKDIIRFYEEIYIKEAVEQNKLWEQLSQRESELAKLNEPKTAMVDLDDETSEAVDSERLNAILAGAEQEPTTDGEALKKQLEEMIASTENMAQKVEEQESIRKPIEESEKGNNVRTLDIKPAKTLLFTPQTTVIGSGNAFGTNKAYEPNFNKPLSQRGLSNANIATVGYANNINDLINERNAKAAANQALVNEIIQNQIAYNNQFGGKVQHANIKQSSTNYGQVANANKAGSFNASASVNTRSNMMSSNFNNQSAIQNQVANSQEAETPVSINKPLLAKKPVLLGKTNQSSPAQTSSVVKPSFNFNRTSHTESNAAVEPNTEVKSSISLQKPLGIKPVEAVNKSKTEDIVGVYKINTKEVAVENEPKKVLVGGPIPTKKF